MVEIWQQQSSRALEAFAACAETKSNDDTVIDQTGLTGAQLHIAHKTLVDMAIDYEAVLGSVSA